MSGTGNKVAISILKLTKSGPVLIKSYQFFKKAGIPMDHYDIMNLAQNPQGWVNTVKSMSNIT
jgi:hypothetical protein